MRGTGIFVTTEELDRVNIVLKCSGMFLSNGMPMGDPNAIVAALTEKYNAPPGSGLNIKTGEFCFQ